jgi:predicted nuclease of predicted toxin-antitoxin system
MRLELDENLPAELVEDLRALGHDTDSVVTEGLAGRPDRAVAGAARGAHRVLLTLDKGLADIRRFPPGSYGGIVLFRLSRIVDSPGGYSSSRTAGCGFADNGGTIRGSAAKDRRARRGGDRSRRSTDTQEALMESSDVERLHPRPRRRRVAAYWSWPRARDVVS